MISLQISTRMRAIRILCLLFTIVLYGCKEDNRPIVVTLDPEIINNNLVRLHAEAHMEGIAEYGFLVDLLPDPDISDALVRNNGSPSAGIFSGELRGLGFGSTYYVRAYVMVNGVVRTGDIKSFTFGGLTPEITGLQPASGQWFDTLKVSGKNFIESKGKTTVTFGSLISTIVMYNGDSMLYCVVPQGLPAGTVDVRIRVVDKPSAGSKPFTLEQPLVSGLTPFQGSFLEQITIQGSGFSMTSSYNKVMFGTTSAEITKATKTSLVVKVPTGIKEPSSTVFVQVDSIRANAPLAFQLNLQTITNLAPTKAKLSETITITGTNFNPVASMNEVWFLENKATVMSATNSQLTVPVPNGIYNKRDVTVRLTIAGTTVDAGSFLLDDAWIRKADIPSGMFGRWGAIGFAIDGKGYAGTGSGNGLSAYSDFYRYEEATNSWTRLADFGGGKRYWTASFVIGQVAYVGTGSETGAGEGNREFYKYNVNNDTWTRVTDFGGAAASRAIGFSVNGKGYVCRSFGADNFWEYDPINDQWIQKADFAAVTQFETNRATGSFVINNKAYVIVTQYSQKELYLYDPLSDTWIKKASVPYEFGSYLPVVLATVTHGYYFDGYAGFEYDPIGDNWRQVTFIPIGSRNEPFSFAIGNTLYVGGGRDGNFKDFWQGEVERF
jgi:hypothetical protein